MSASEDPLPRPAWPIRYFLDEYVDAGIVSYLRAHGINVLTAHEAGRANRGISDRDQLEFSTAQGRVLVSRDKHFLNTREVPQLASGRYVGIVALRRTVGVGEQARYLRFIAETDTPETIVGQIRYYEPIPRGMFPDD